MRLPRDGDSIGSKDGAEGICSSAARCCGTCGSEENKDSSVEGDKDSNERIGSGFDLGGDGHSNSKSDSEAADSDGDGWMLRSLP